MGAIIKERRTKNAHARILLDAHVHARSDDGAGGSGENVTPCGKQRDAISCCTGCLKYALSRQSQALRALGGHSLNPDLGTNCRYGLAHQKSCSCHGLNHAVDRVMDSMPTNHLMRRKVATINILVWQWENVKGYSGLNPT